MFYKMRSQRLKKRGFPKKILLAIIPLVICLSLLAIPLGLANRIKITISSPLKPIQKAFLVAGKGVKRAFLWIPVSWQAFSRVEELEGEVLCLQNKVATQEAVINRLQTELSSVTEYYRGVKLGQKPLLAHVIAYDSTDLRRSILIDVGSRHGITLDSLVLAKDALVGRVSAVGNSTSRVLLITDPASRIPARILETSDVGVVEGGSGELCRLKYLSRWGSKVEEGYKVVSAPIGGVYPDALFIATVAETLEEEGIPYKTLRLKPRFDLAKVDTVLVLKKEDS